jgi:uncharacterized protein
MRVLRRLTAAGFAVLGLLATFVIWTPAVSATDFPRLAKSPVVDQAKILTPAEEDRMSTKLHDIEAKSGHQVAVATIRSLEGIEIEDYGLMLGRRWAIGRKGVDDGVMILVAPNDRRTRLEVGVGLESTFSNAVAQDIIDSVMTPRFKEGEFATGIDHAIDRIAYQFTVDPNAPEVQPVFDTQNSSESDVRAQSFQTAYQSPKPTFGFGEFVLLIVLFVGGPLCFLAVIISAFSSGRGGVSNWNSNSNQVYVDSSPTVYTSSSPSRFTSSSSGGNFSSSSSSSGGFSGGGGGHFRGGGASGSW